MKVLQGKSVLTVPGQDQKADKAEMVLRIDPVNKGLVAFIQTGYVSDQGKFQVVSTEHYVLHGEDYLKLESSAGSFLEEVWQMLKTAEKVDFT